MNLNNDREQQESAAFWHGQGCAYCEREAYMEAVAAFDRAIALDPNYCQAWSNRGNALGATGRYAEALVSYDRAVAIAPQYHQAWFNRGLLLAEMMAYGNAMESYDRAIAIEADPRYVHAREAIGLKRQLICF
jgi:tetratricopeptide (TPR) repeat protein